MKHLSYISLLLFIFSQSASAEYRVYQYYVKNKMERFQGNGSYLVTSTLDPLSYQSYHGGPMSLRVDLLRTWTCKGNTGDGKKVCKAPLENSTTANNTTVAL